MDKNKLTKKINQSSPSTMIITKDAYLIPGIVLIVFTLLAPWIIMLNQDIGSAPGKACCIGILIPIFIGGLSCLQKMIITIDLSKGTITKQWKIFELLVKEQLFAVNIFNNVNIVEKISEGESGNFYSYIVYLEGGGTNLELNNFTDTKKAEALGKKVAEFLKIKFTNYKDTTVPEIKGYKPRILPKPLSKGSIPVSPENLQSDFITETEKICPSCGNVISREQDQCGKCGKIIQGGS